MTTPILYGYDSLTPISTHLFKITYKSNSGVCFINIKVFQMFYMYNSDVLALVG